MLYEQTTTVRVCGKALVEFDLPREPLSAVFGEVLVSPRSGDLVDGRQSRLLVVADVDAVTDCLRKCLKVSLEGGIVTCYFKLLSSAFFAPVVNRTVWVAWAARVRSLWRPARPGRSERGGAWCANRTG